MRDYLIEQAKVGVSEGGFACGPAGGSVVASVLYKNKAGIEKWIHCVETEGIPAFYESDDDIHERLVADDPDDEEFWDMLNDSMSIDEIDGLSLGEYDLIFEGCKKESIAVPLIRYLIVLIRCETKDVESLISLAKGNYIDQVDLPVSDVEKDWASSELY